MDLSDPAGFSINDGIDRELCSLKYVSVDDAVRSVVDLGPGTLIAKLDIESAYRIVPVHTSCRQTAAGHVVERSSICDRICENVHSSHIHFFNFRDS